MKLLTEELKQQLPPLYSQEKVDFLFFGWVHSDFSEMGYFSLNEIEHTEVGGLGIERNLHFTPKKLSEVKKEQQ